MAETLSTLEDQMTRIRHVAAEVANRIVGPSPSCTPEDAQRPSHILARLQELSRQADEIGTDLEQLLNNL